MINIENEIISVAPEEVCRLIFGEACDSKQNDAQDWQIPIPGNHMSEPRNAEYPHVSLHVLIFE